MTDIGDKPDKRAGGLRGPSEAEYEIGYAKPPVATRFQPGRSGNPRGRPKGSRNKKPALNEERLKSIVLEEAYRTITVRDGDRNVTVPMAQAVVRSIAVNAAKGQHRAQRLFAEMLSTTERQNRALADSWLETAIDYKVEWERELDRRDRLGIEGPEPLPHPDHVKIDFRRGTAWVEGPATKEEKAELEWLLNLRADVVANLDELETALATEVDAEERADLERYIKVGKETLQKLQPIERFVQDEPND